MSARLRARLRKVLAGLLIAAATAGALVPATPAAAQTTNGADIELLRQPLYYRAGADLGLQLKVTNRTDAPLQGFQVQIALYEHATGRIDLHESFDGPDVDDESLGVQVVPFDRDLAPGATTTVTVDLSLASFGLGEEGVYPMVVELYDASFTQPLDTFTTAAIYYPEPPDEAARLNFVLVVPLLPPPARGPAGSFVPDANGEFPLEEALADDGWISGLLEALRSATLNGLSVALAPSPRFVEELAGMSDGFARARGDEVEEVAADSPSAEAAAAALTQLEELATSPRVQALASPYASTDIPTIYEIFSLEHVTKQLDAGRAALTAVVPEEELDTPWLYVDGSRWDGKTLEQVRLLGDLSTFVDPSLFDPPIDETIRGCPGPDISPPGSFTCSVEIQTGAASVPAYVADPDVKARLDELAARDSTPLYLHRFFAETALIHAEQPDAARRVVHASLPSSWQPSPTTASRLLNGLARAPWLAPRTPSGGFTRSVRPRERSIVDEVGPLPVDGDYVSALREAARAVDTFIEIGAPEQRRDRLTGNLLVAEDRRWWLDASLTPTGLSYATESQREIEEEFAKITISGPNTTLTSQRSAIEVNVFNETSYPVTVDVDFESSRPGAMRIDESNASELQDIVVEPGSAPAIKVDAIADTSGIFQVKAAVESPDSGREINHQNITVRSTNFNQIALGLTLGALAFLILFYVLRFVRRRRTPQEVRPESATL